MANFDEFVELAKRQEIQELEMAPSFCQTLTLRKVVLWVFLAFAFILSWKIFLKELTDAITEIFKEHAKSNNPLSLSFFVLVIMVFSLVPIPGMSYFSIIMSYFQKSFFKSLLIIFIGCYGAGMLAWYVIRHHLKNYFLKIYGKTLLFRVFQSECDKNPWAISVISNVLILPACTKNYLLPLTEMTFPVFAIPKIPFYSFFGLIFVLVGMQLKDFEEMINGSSFFDKSPLEKFYFIISLLLILISVLVGFYFSYISKSKFKEFEEKDMMAKRFLAYKEQLERRIGDNASRTHLEEIKSTYNIDDHYY